MTNASKIATLNASLKTARKIVNKAEQLSPEFHAGMVEVRRLTDAIDALTDFGPYASHEGDVFSC